jgi:uncharacterized protein (UPF0332 family)/predicted nucleotidyltransferase
MVPDLRPDGERGVLPEAFPFLPPAFRIGLGSGAGKHGSLVRSEALFPAQPTAWLLGALGCFFFSVALPGSVLSYSLRRGVGRDLASTEHQLSGGLLELERSVAAQMSMILFLQVDSGNSSSLHLCQNMNRLSERAITELKERLLAGPHGFRVLKIVVFGSNVKGTARGDSDLDVLLVLSEINGVVDFLFDLTIDIHSKYRIGLEPILVTVDDLFPTTSYFLFNILRYGKEVYTVPEKSLRDEERKNLLNLAEEYLEGARVAAEKRLWRLAVDAGYNAIELAVKSLILGSEDDLPGSHGGVIGKFGELFIRSGRYDKSLGREIHQALEKRNRARYQFHASIGKTDAEGIMDTAETTAGLARRALDG